MKITLVTQHYAPHFEGGTETVVRAQAAALVERGHELAVISGTDRPHPGEDVERCEVDGIPVSFLFRLPDEPYGLELARPRLCEQLTEELTRGGGPDLVHVHHWSTLGDTLVRSLAVDYPLVLGLHDLFSTCPRFFRVPPDERVQCPPPGELGACADCVSPDLPGLPRPVLLAALGHRAATFRDELRAASALLVPSRSQGTRLAELTGLDPAAFRVLPHGLCGPHPGRATPPEPGAPLRVLHIGHRSRTKGTLDLVRALAALPAGGAELVLAGSEVEPGFDALLEREAGSLRLHRTGAYDRGDLATLAAGAHLAAFPSRAWESYSLVVDEALALGLPVWVSDRGAPPERIGAAGRVLPAKNPGVWSAALGEILDNPAAAAALAAERAAVPEHLPGAAEAARELETIYTHLPAPPSAP